MSKGNMATCTHWKQSKTNIYIRREKKKKTLLVGILAVIGRYGPHLMIVNVMIFVTQNNF